MAQETIMDVLMEMVDDTEEEQEDMGQQSTAAPRRSSRSAASSNSATTRRRGVEPVRYAQFQAEEIEMSKLRYQQQVVRKGEKRRLEGNGNGTSKGSRSGGSSASNKQSRAEARRSARQSRRRDARSPRSDADTDVALWQAMPAMALDGSGPQSRKFTKPEDAVHSTVLHSTTWRHVQLPLSGTTTTSSLIPSNLVPLNVGKAFATALDKTLDAYDADVARQCAILRPTELRQSVQNGKTHEEIYTKVTSALEHAAPLIKNCHARRVTHVLETTRRDVRAYLAQLALQRRQFSVKFAEKHVKLMPITPLDQVAARKLLLNSQPASAEEEADALPTYYVGKGENTVRERPQLPKQLILLNRLPFISRSTTCIGVHVTIPVDDDPIIRYVPYFSQATKADTQFTQFPSFAAMQKAALSALDDESNEYVLRYVVRACGGDPRVFRVLKQMAWGVQPQTDYTALQVRDARERLARQQSGDSCSRSSRNSTLKQRLSGDSLSGQVVVDPPATPDALVAGLRSLFCRRCYVYNCQLHGINQPVAHARIDPVHPRVKTTLRHLVDEDEEEDEHDGDDDGGGEEQVDGPEDDDELEVATAMEIEMVETDTTVMRRSGRSVTVAATNASTILVSQYKKPSKRSASTSSGRSSKSQKHDDGSEYMGYESIYRRITEPRLTTVMFDFDDEDAGGGADEGRVCSMTCHRALLGSGNGNTVETSWTPQELLVLDLAQRTTGRHACALAVMVETKTCAQVHAQLARMSQHHDQDAAADLRHLRLASSSSSRTAANPHEHVTTTTTTIRGNTQEHLLRTRFQRMKDRGSNHQYVPCHHTGTSCNDSDCGCMRRDHFCEKSCGCPRDCANRFPGCKCARGECGTAACPCFFSGRECDPDLCGSCGACEIAVLVLGPATQFQSNKKLRICANTNILRGAHRKIGVSESNTHGWGAYALEDIAESEFIYEYTGELLSQDEAERRGNVYDRNAVSFLFDLNEDAVVDAARKGNKSKFANHSSMDPNCVARIMLVNGDHRIGLYAKRAIAKGDELFFDYGHHGVVPDWSQARIRLNGIGSKAMEEVAVAAKPSSAVVVAAADDSCASSVPSSPSAISTPNGQDGDEQQVPAVEVDKPQNGKATSVITIDDDDDEEEQKDDVMEETAMDVDAGDQ